MTISGPEMVVSGDNDVVGGRTPDMKVRKNEGQVDMYVCLGESKVIKE